VEKANEGEVENQKDCLFGLQEFLLKEYECIWSLYRINYEIRDRWVRFYFLMIGIASGLIGAFFNFFQTRGYHNGVDPEMNLLICIILFLLFSFGLVVFLHDLVLRFSRREAYHVMNLIRRAFLDKYPDVRKYVFFPVNPPLRPFGWRDWIPTGFLLIAVSVNYGVFVWFLARLYVFSLVATFIALVGLLFIFGERYDFESGRGEATLAKIGWNQKEIEEWKRDTLKEPYSRSFHKRFLTRIYSYLGGWKKLVSKK